MPQAVSIVRLSAGLDADLTRWGGKGAGLVRLLRAGLAVPEAWVIPALDPNAPPGGLYDELRAFWEAFRAEWPAGKLAVRSSAVAEDLADASFAGIYRTVLGVETFEALIEAAETCLNAVHGPEAQAYREKTGQTDMRMAIVLQRLVPAGTAGVMLTVNPLRPLAGELVVDASYGIGEAVVSGRVHPDHYVLRKNDGGVLRFEIGAKEFEILSGPDGLDEFPVGEERRAAACLDAAALAALWQAAVKIEAAIGPGQDCEWAFEDGRLYLLQQRPIVGLPPADPKNVHSRRFGDEYVADYTLPLSHSVLMPWISEHFLMDFARTFGFAERLTAYPTLRHEGYAYVSGEYVVELMSAAPRFLRKPEAIGWFGAEWNARIRAAPFRPRQLLRMLRAGWADPLASADANREALARHCAELQSAIQPLLMQDYVELDDETWERQYVAALAWGDAHFRVIKWGMGFLNPIYHSLLQERLTRWCKDDGTLYRTIISGLPTKTNEVNRALWALGQAALARPGLADGIRADTPLYELRAAFPGARFLSAFEDFMRAYGHRGATRDIAVPRWGETPAVVLGLVRVQLNDGALDPRFGEALAEERRRAAEAEALARARPWHRPFLRSLMKRAQEFTVYRENQRFYLDMVLYHVRNLVRAAAVRLVARGVIEEIDDVFFLSAEEFEAARLPGAVALHERVAERKTHYLRWRDRLPATFLLDGVEVELMAAALAAASPEDMRGTPASQGKARGRVRVAHELADLRLVRPGEILVAKNTDPGWTSVFPLLVGLVTCTGGVLSHGALLAREYGIPAVTGVSEAMDRLKTGDLVEIDATAGIVRLVRSVSSAT